MEKLKQEPALVIGFLMSLIVAVVEILDVIAQNKALGVAAVIQACIPVLAGALIRSRVVSTEWLTQVLTHGREVLKQGETALDAIAEQVKVPPPTP